MCVTTTLICMVIVVASPTHTNADNSLSDAFEFSLNGLHFTIDKTTGSILNIYSAGIDTILSTTGQLAGIIDIAYPVREFQPLRLASRYSRNVQIESAADTVTIFWPELGASRPIKLPGRVSATVQFRVAPDKKSVIMTCSIRNESEQNIPQVLFPDLFGLLPVAGQERTVFRTATESILPFKKLNPNPETVAFYSTGMFHVGNGWLQYKSGEYNIFSQKLVDWLDYGDIGHGFSLFAKRWVPEEPYGSIMMHLSETSGTLRLLFSHTTDIAPHTQWQSDEYWITPRQHGWAEGIKPFRQWVEQNFHRPHPVPEHIKNGMGYRTVWMANGVTTDPEYDALYRYNDLPRLAQEAREHGLNEMVVWFWCPYLQLPLTTLDYLGSEQELIDAVKECKKMGVNVNLLISVLYLADPSASRYGLTPVKEMSWTYHPDLIPHFKPPYATWNWSVLANQDNEQWQADVLASCKKFIDLGLTSFVWDVFAATPTKPNLYDLAGKIRDLAPNAVFAGEGGYDIGQDYKYLDYTWNWNWNWPTYKDFRAFTSVFPAPRLNVNIDRSVKVAKYSFADNAFMNIMPSAPDGINASDLIENHPLLSLALKQCARLRQQFLPYFSSGIMIGDCFLAKACDSAHISTYVMKDRVLMILVKDETAGPVSINVAPKYWLPSATGQYRIKIYKADGKIVEQKVVQNEQWQEKTGFLQPLDILLFEIAAL